MRCPECHRRLPAGAACPRHAQHRAPTSQPAEVPPRWSTPPLRDFAFLGRGGFATVFAATREDGARVAIKLALEREAPRFSREAAALRRLGPPITPALFDEGRLDDGRPWLMLECLRGRSLASWLAACPDATPPARAAMALFGRLCVAVDRVHAVGLVHRDLKPENIFVDGDADALRLLDFGLARETGAGSAADDVSLTRTGERLGTVSYMAPEQCAGTRAIDARADVYALGVILFELLTGRPPFVGDATTVMEEQLLRRPPRPSDLVELPSALEDVVLRALAKDPGDRQRSAADLGSAALAAAALPVARRPVPSRGAASVSRRATVALLAVESRSAANAIVAAAAAHGGQVARVAGRRYVIAFPGIGVATGVPAALRAAAALQQLSGRCVVHAAELRIDEGARGSQLSGAALERLAAWWPPDDGGDGIFVTADAGATPTVATIDAATAPGFRRPAPAAEAPPEPIAAEVLPLRGRDELIARLLAEAESAFADGAPSIATVVGAPGQGKSRILGALVEPLARSARIIRLAVRAGVPPEPLVPPPDGAPGPVALLVDDVDVADPRVLDALEAAASGETSRPLWICVTSTAAMPRSGWADRAARATRHVVEPLDGAAARALLLDLLRPVEYVPDAVVERLADLAQRVPLDMVELTRALRATGGIRRHRGSSAWYLAADDVVNVAGTELGERLMARILTRLPALLAEIARQCAVVGNDVTVADLDALQAILRGDGALDASADPGAAMLRLEELGLVRAIAPGRYAFRQPMLRKALEQTTPAPVRRRLHEAARRSIEHSGNSGRQARLRLARHAAACGAADQAATLYLALADEARRRHAYLEAEELYSCALGQCGATDPRRETALAGRGRSRYLHERLADALDDLRAARAAAVARGDEAAVADLLLEEATALDWSDDYAGSARTVEQAGLIIERLGDAALAARHAMARGRSHVRADRHAEAIDSFSEALRRAEALGDDETRVLSLLLLPGSLCYLGRFDEAQLRYEEVIALCERIGDRGHLAAAYGNRVLLWVQLHQHERAISDSRRAVALAQELGRSKPERFATRNLAFLLYWSGALDEALDKARHVRDLGLRYLSSPEPEDTLLVARVLARRGEGDEVRKLLASVERSGGTSYARLICRMLELSVCPAGQRLDAGDFAAEWRALLDEARQDAFVPDELLELLSFGAETALRVGQPSVARWAVDQAATIEGGASAWQARFAALAAELPHAD